MHKNIPLTSVWSTHAQPRVTVIGTSAIDVRVKERGERAMPANIRTFIEEERKLPLVLIVGSTFFAGVCLTAFINRAELGLIVSQFGALWSIEQNRQEILRVCFKILGTGIMFGALALACSLAASYARNQRNEQEDAI